MPEKRGVMDSAIKEGGHEQREDAARCDQDLASDARGPEQQAERERLRHQDKDVPPCEIGDLVAGRLVDELRDQREQGDAIGERHALRIGSLHESADEEREPPGVEYEELGPGEVLLKIALRPPE